MQLRHLESFLAVVQDGSISRAAARLHVAQPALSRQIQHLERRAGGLLLVRSARGVVPTDLGMSLLPRAQRVWRPGPSPFSRD